MATTGFGTSLKGDEVHSIILKTGHAHPAIARLSVSGLSEL